MSNIAYAASVAQQGLRDLGKGMAALGDKKSDRLAGEAFREAHPGTQGNQLAEQIRLGKVESGDAERLVQNEQSLNPMTVAGSLVKIITDPNAPEEAKLQAKATYSGMMQLLTATAAIKKKSSSDGKGSKSKKLTFKDIDVNDTFETALFILQQDTPNKTVAAQSQVDFTIQYNKLANSGASEKDLVKFAQDYTKKNTAARVAASKISQPQDPSSLKDINSIQPQVTSAYGWDGTEDGTGGDQQKTQQDDSTVNPGDILLKRK